ncbi:hypothetical protein Tco_1114203 [Tanacetum coccineum]|uniref:Uncharacterized protein n=1 Tax=Tanacetum coccineum TaxID=301880 RepID=A0ABQ5IVX9_9ASTR
MCSTLNSFDVEGVYGETSQFIASSSKWANGSGGAYEACFSEVEYNDMKDGNGYSQKDKNKANKDKTEHGIGRI